MSARSVDGFGLPPPDPILAARLEAELDRCGPRIAPAPVVRKKPIVHVCHGCGRESATWPGDFPRGWVKLNGQPVCRTCARNAR